MHPTRRIIIIRIIEVEKIQLAGHLLDQHLRLTPLSLGPFPNVTLNGPAIQTESDPIIKPQNQKLPSAVCRLIDSRFGLGTLSWPGQVNRANEPTITRLNWTWPKIRGKMRHRREREKKKNIFLLPLALWYLLQSNCKLNHKTRVGRTKEKRKNEVEQKAK